MSEQSGSSREAWGAELRPAKPAAPTYSGTAASGQCSRASLIAVIVLQLLTLGHRICFDVLGDQLGLVAASGLTVLLCLVGFGGAIRRSAALLLSYCLYMALWIAFNALVIVSFHGFDELRNLVDLGRDSKENKWADLGVGLSVAWVETIVAGLQIFLAILGLCLGACVRRSRGVAGFDDAYDGFEMYTSRPKSEYHIHYREPDPHRSSTAL